MNDCRSSFLPLSSLMLMDTTPIYLVILKGFPCLVSYCLVSYCLVCSFSRDQRNFSLWFHSGFAARFLLPRVDISVCNVQFWGCWSSYQDRIDSLMRWLMVVLGPILISCEENLCLGPMLYRHTLGLVSLVLCRLAIWHLESEHLQT